MKRNFEIYKQVGIALLGGALIIGTPILVKKLNSPRKKIARYAENLYVLQHDFVYAATIELEGERNTIYLVKDAQNRFDIWEPGENANRLEANAFMLDDSGTCVTSSQALSPWASESDRNLLLKLLRTQFDLQEDQVRLDGQSISLVIIPRASEKNPSGEPVKCIPLGTVPEGEMEIAYLKPVEKFSTNIRKQVQIPDAINGDNEKIFLLNDSKVFSVLKEGRSSMELRSSTYFQLEDIPGNPGEGSPVFNKTGKLIGVYTSLGNNFISLDLGRYRDINGYIQERNNYPVETDESYLFLVNKETNTPEIKPRKWATVLDFNDENPEEWKNYASDMADLQRYVMNWRSPIKEFIGKNVRLIIIVDNIRKDDEVSPGINVVIEQLDENGYLVEESFSGLYSNNGSFTENLWEFNGYFQLRIEAMFGSKFQVQLQVEE